MQPDSPLELDAVLQTLAGETGTGMVNRLEIIIKALSDDEWLKCVKHWRVTTAVKEIPLDAGTQSRATPKELAAVA